jgi:hypothetical protein
LFDLRRIWLIARRLETNAYTFNDPQTPARPPDSSKLEFRLEPQTKILRKIKELGDLGGALGAAIDRLEQAVRRQGILLLNRDPAAGV